MDFVAILSNILENAVNGCKECGAHGKINVNIRTVSDKTVIVCSNSCKPGLVIENNMIKHRGIGIESMLTAARKYDGDISYRLENDVLTLCVILKKWFWKPIAFKKRPITKKTIRKDGFLLYFIKFNVSGG